MATKSKTKRNKLPTFLSQIKLRKLGKLDESKMETVAQISPPASISTAAKAKKKKLVIKCVDTNEGVVCTYKWV